MTDQYTGTARSTTTPNETFLIHNFEHRAYPLDGERPFTIGRDSRCDIMVSEVSVSRQHAELRPDGDQYVLHPLGSTPTYLNDREITSPQTLRSGDTITVGTMRFSFVRGQLPVAVTVVPSQERMLGVNDYVSDRRPTLTFPILPLQSGGPSRQFSPWLWVIIFVALVIIVYGVDKLFLHR